MGKKIESIEGIGTRYGKKLRNSGCGTVEQLLELGGTRAGRKRLATESGLDEKRILKAVNMADLFRVKGIGAQYAELLEAAGVDTVKELRNRNAGNLAAKMTAVNESRNLVRQVPSEATVEKWILQAKELPPVVSH
ncbi:MAG: DUF4332 domain-containing protein [Xanthomonadales bacterium]|nr:DUF4332 domain-containing protein [Xanthomonadales bacterium]